MDTTLDPEALLIRQRANLLQDLGNAANASQAAEQRSAVSQLSDTAQNLRSINTSQTAPLDPSRGRNLDISV